MAESQFSSTAAVMPALAPFSSQNSYPALYLYPLNDSFVPKHIALHHAQRVKIGRQTNAKTAPGERNGYFDSKVLSRQHAEVWEEGNKVGVHILTIIHSLTATTRFTSKTSSPLTVLSSTVTDLAERVSSQNRGSSTATI